jgi:hypothetical protein
VIKGDRTIRLLLSLVYWVFRRMLELVVLRLRSERSKELEILVLRHQLHVLQRQVARPRVRPADRLLLAALSRSLPKAGMVIVLRVACDTAALASRAGRAALDVCAVHGWPPEDGSWRHRAGAATGT